MKKHISLLLALVMSLSALASCGENKDTNNPDTTNPAVEDESSTNPEKLQIEGTKIELSDTEVLVDGTAATDDNTKAVYVARDIVYYEEGHDFTYGEGEKEDEHSKEEADKHLVVHITKPGDYVLSGTMSFGQIAVDLGKDAKEDPAAVVNLYLNGVDITNTVAPAVIFYNVYEPFADVTEETATKDVNTSAAGANVFIVDDTENNITGSYVARIYKPDSVVLSEDGKSVEDAKKLHKYDAAFYSKSTMNIGGGEKNTGVLNIKADNEGLDSEMHLTVSGGIINIESGNDGINTNEDGISVTTVNGGTLNIFVNGSTGEGDGIDSNGWLVINGGTVISQACAFSGDAGIDSDMGIHINGGTVIASGNMLDRISQSNQTFVVLSFNEFLGKGIYTLKNVDNEAVAECDIQNNFTYLIISNDKLLEGDYTLWYGDIQLAGSGSETDGMAPPEGFNGEMPEGMTPPEGFNGEMPEDMTPPEDFNGEKPEGMTPPYGFDGGKMDFERNEDGTVTLPDGSIVDPSQFGGKGQGGRGPGGGFGGNMPGRDAEMSEIFTIKAGANYFSFIEAME